MNDTRMICIRKRDGSLEEFSIEKLTGCLWRVLYQAGGTFCEARELAMAISIFLGRSRRREVTSNALFEMAVKSLRRIRRGDAAELLELHRALRAVRRPLLCIQHDNGQVTEWDKTWVARLAEGVWNLSRSTGRLLAGEIEMELLPQQDVVLSRQAILRRLNEKVSQFGLADAVPVRTTYQDA